MIEIINLQKELEAKPVLKNINLTIETGKTTVIIGRSGCGKSVLLKHIIGLFQPDSGQVIINEKDITRMNYKQLIDLRMNISMLFQGGALFDSLTIGENVAFSILEHKTMSRNDIKERVRLCLDLVGLRGIEHLKPAQLSGGMQKRVGLARAICMQPEIVLYDEPTTGLDPIMADIINDLIIDLKDKLKVTSVVVTHDMRSAYKIGDKIAMLYDGKIIAEGTPEQIKNSQSPVVQQFITGASTGPITEGENLKHI
ncbi:MAG: ABC transporter ATP-binding protein [Candidatus Omnitrophica bacterium]|nr:ABC transporter ATP-binding protein [Candidatus Omnitrophota bacterium]